MFHTLLVRWAPYSPIAVAVLLSLISLANGLQLDDYYHWGLITGNPLAIPANDTAGVFGLFSFLDGDVNRTRQLMDAGMVPWWTLPDIQYAFWRPVSELTHGLDYLLWPDSPWLMHLHSLVYFALVIWLFYRLIFIYVHDFLDSDRATKNTVIVWAIWIYALAYSHGLPAGWLANRNALLATIFVVLTLLAHHQWRKTGSRHSAIAAFICFILGLLCGELAVSAGLMLLAYAVCLENKGWVGRALSIAHYAVAGLVWLILRAGLGYGAKGSGHYIDPTHFGEAIVLISERAVKLLAGQIWSLPPEFMPLVPGHLPVQILLLLVMAALLIPILIKDRLARFWALSGILCVLPVCATMAHSRLLMCVSISFSALMAIFLVCRRQAYPSLLVQKASAIVAGLYMVTAFIFSPLLLPLEAVSIKLNMDSMLNKAALSMELKENQKVILINPPMSSVAGYMNGVRAYHGLPVAESLVPLVSGLNPVELKVIGNNALEVSVKGGVYNYEQESLLRDPDQPLAVNDRVTFNGIGATVLKVNEKGVPTQVRFEFPEPIVGPGAIALMHWNKGHPEHCTLDKVGQTFTLTLKTESCPPG